MRGMLSMAKQKEYLSELQKKSEAVISRRGEMELFSKSSPSALDCAEPIVIREGAFTRSSRIDGEERGSVPVTVMVVREMAGEAEFVATACERWLHSCDWEPHAEDGGWRIVGIDTAVPAFRERDSSGRFVYEFTVEVTAVRSV